MNNAEQTAPANEQILEFKFKTTGLSKEYRESIKEAYIQNKHCKTLPALVEKMKNYLDEKHPKGWIVFGGKHMVGSCTFLKNTMADFTVDDTAFVVFKMFVPN
ncbi:hypothetical protein ENBRE01_0934 [Enteropsectra breve]|nr:hypothetical protein ENBRE01_0934 [Enteropsectra breve]